MKLKRARLWFAAGRLRRCFQLFQNPWHAHFGLAFLTRHTVQVVLKNGNKLAFSRDTRDHRFWDWILGQTDASFDFTPEGELRLKTSTHELFLRSGTSDFFAYREIFLQDCYGLKDLPERLGTVVDLGVNVGLFTCAIQGRAERVVGVEPAAVHFRQARKNIQHNGGDAGGLLQVAVAGESGREVSFHVDDHNAGSSSFYKSLCRSPRQPETVRTISLADLLDLTHCESVDLMKCDIEGAEFDVFLNTPLNVLHRVRRLVMEVHLNVEQSATKEQALVAHLRSAGMAVTLKTPPGTRPVISRMLTAQRP